MILKMYFVFHKVYVLNFKSIFSIYHFITI